jgi:glutaredoxin
MAETPPAVGKRRIPGLAIVAVIAVVLFVQMQYYAVERVYCEGEVVLPGARSAGSTGADAPDVVMLGASWCQYCKTATRLFTEHAIHFCEYDIETSPVGRRLYEEFHGQGVPVILIGTHRLQGYDEDSVMHALRMEELL